MATTGPQNVDEDASFRTRLKRLFRPAWTTNVILPNLRAFSKDLGLPHSNEEKGDGRRNTDTTEEPKGLDINADGGSRDHEGDLEGRRYARTVPPGVDPDENENEDIEAGVESHLLPRYPNASHAPQHNFIPAPKPGPDPGRRKKMDAGRSRQPVILHQPLSLTAERWQSFGRNGHAPRMPEESGELVDDDWEKERLANLDKPWHPQAIEQHDEETDGLWFFSEPRRAAARKRYRRILMNNPFVVLIIRLIVLLYVLIALGMGATIYHRTNVVNAEPSKHSMNGVDQDDSICQQQPSTYMAFIVDSCAIIYLFYITFDEYTSKPLGLRKTRDKLRLLFLDIIFIVFSAANLALAFDTLLDQQWACYEGHSAAESPPDLNAVAQSTCIYDTDLCKRQRTLCAVLMIALVMWLQTFAISVFRVIERISH